MEGLLGRDADIHLHFETQHVVFLQRVQPDLRNRAHPKIPSGSSCVNFSFLSQFMCMRSENFISQAINACYATKTDMVAVDSI